MTQSYFESLSQAFEFVGYQAEYTPAALPPLCESLIVSLAAVPLKLELIVLNEVLVALYPERPTNELAWKLQLSTQMPWTFGPDQMPRLAELLLTLNAAAPLGSLQVRQDKLIYTYQQWSDRREVLPTLVVGATRLIEAYLHSVWPSLSKLQNPRQSVTQMAQQFQQDYLKL